MEKMDNVQIQDGTILLLFTLWEGFFPKRPLGRFPAEALLSNGCFQ